MNVTTLFGHVGSEPVHKEINPNSSVTSFSLAINKSYTNSKDEKVETTSWYQCEIWNKPNIVNFIKKGDSILLTGEARAEAYINNEGKAMATHKLRVDTITFTTPKSTPEMQAV